MGAAVGMAARLAGAASKVLARLHRWYAAAWILARVPLAALDATSIGRLRYALMMAHHTHPKHAADLMHGLIDRNGSVSADLHIELAAMATALDLPDLADGQLSFARQKANSSATLDAADKLLRLNRAVTMGTLRTEVHSRIDGLLLPDTGLLTLVPVSGKYLDLWDLWLSQVRTHACRHIVVMAMDDAAYTALAGEPDVAVVDVREFFSWDGTGRLHPHTRGVLWYLRVLLLQDLVCRGHTVLVLDLDAIPVGDVNGMVTALPPADVVAQQDHSIPMDVDRELGFVLCCGVMLWRPTVSSLHLLERFAAACTVERDDQLALNHLLAQDGIRERKEEDGVLSFRCCEARFVCPAPSQVSRSLLTGTVVRHFHQTGESVAAIRDALKSTAAD